MPAARIIFRAALIGFTLGLLLAVWAGSCVWLEMRVNLGLLIPAATVLCPGFAFAKREIVPYALFLAVQALLGASLLAIYGFDAGALWVIPASLFREGFRVTGLPLKTAGLIGGGILLGGNLVWLACGVRGMGAKTMHPG